VEIKKAGSVMKRQDSRRASMKFYQLLAVAGVIYAGVSVLTPIPPGSETYNLSSVAIKLLQLTLVLPIIAIWFIALYGALGFRDYSHSINKSPDGKALGTVASGLLFLIGSLVVSTLLGAAQPYMFQHGMGPLWTIITNYVAVLSLLLAFWRIHEGAKQLGALVGYRGVDRRRLWALTILVPTLIAYVWLMFHNPYRLHSPNTSKIVPYYLPDILLFATIIVPYALTWYFGLMASAYLRAYHANAQGIIYRRSLTGLSNGLIAVIASSLTIQLVTAVSPAVSTLGLEGVLSLLYLLIGIYALGHIWILNGARRLQKIEEVT
jgi:hypothetical protein